MLGCCGIFFIGCLYCCWGVLYGELVCCWYGDGVIGGWN